MSKIKYEFINWVPAKPGTVYIGVRYNKSANRYT